MQAVQLLLPAVATAALGTALLVPLRDDRRGRRATIGPGNGPFRPDFGDTLAAAPVKPIHANEVRSDDVQAVDLRTDDVRTDNLRAVDVRAVDQSLTCEAVDSIDSNFLVSSEARDVEGSGSSLAAPSEIATFVTAPCEATLPRTLLEPADFLKAIARPFLGARAALIGFFNLPIVRSEPSLQEPAVEDFEATSIERSFANEVASLLQASARVVAEPEQPSNARTSAVEPSSSAPSEPAGAAVPQRLASVAVPSDAPTEELKILHEAAPALVRYQKPAARDVRRDTGSKRDEPSEAPEVANSERATRNGVMREDRDSDAPRVDAWKYGSAQNIVVAPVPARPERAVPITRLPLRPQGFDITWTADVPEFERTEPLSRSARHRLLEGFVRDPGSVSGEVIARAYRQEEGDGRAIALRVLLRNFPQAGRSSFNEALRVGSDEERALAVDGLAAIGAREEIAPAFSDRVDAIAAKAALAYVGTLDRADYRAALSPFIDETQIEAILNLLAGIVE